jgi:hypothetical protein
MKDRTLTNEWCMVYVVHCGSDRKNGIGGALTLYSTADRI